MISIKISKSQNENVTIAMEKSFLNWIIEECGWS